VRSRMFLNLTVCPETLCNVITKDIGLGHRIERKRPWLRLKQKVARLNHINWTEEDWKRVVWSDEMGMHTDANQGFKWIWRYPEEEYHEYCCRGTIASGSGR
jgi:hypothetical protein